MPRLLYLVHSLPPDEHSGTPLFAYGYACSLATRGFDVTVAYTTDSATSWDLVPERRGDEPFDRVVVPPTSYRGQHWSIQAPSDNGADAPRATEAFQHLLRVVRPDLVHVVNNVHLPLNWPELAQARGIPVVRSVTCAEDLCGLIAPVSPRSGPDGTCTAPLTPEHCARCIAAVTAAAAIDAGEKDAGPGDTTSTSTLPLEITALDGPGRTPSGVAPVSKADRRSAADEHRRLTGSLQQKRARSASQYRRVFDRVIFATAGFRQYFEQTLPLDPATVRVIGMGMDLAPWLAQRGDRAGGGSDASTASIAAAPSPDPNPGRPVVFCLAATLDPAKGFDAVTHAFTRPALLERDDYRLVLLGGGNDRLVAPMLAANPHVTWHGPYRSEDLPELLSHVDVGLSTSYFETFHRVTREYLLAGRPVIGSRAFGIPDVIRPGHNGLLFDHAEAGSLARAVIMLLDDRDLLAALTRGARTTVVRSTDDEADDLAALYAEVLAEAGGPSGSV